ncbi:MAG: DUF5069 domain-containing protein [Verrucomicrobiae bacterium]|nr:DUF5069 domain-containing protein [Verrucomicrobiae bacterium]
MSERDWEQRFREVYDRAVQIFDADGGRTPEECFGAEEQAFLATLGCTPQELYDFVEDWCWSKEPSFEEVLEVTSIRREYFLERQAGRKPGRVKSPSEFPSGNEELAGIRWLPRILAKARAKLRGELPPQLMYGCGGDRPFLASVGVGLAEFLRAVRDAGDDDGAVVALLKRRMNEEPG